MRRPDRSAARLFTGWDSHTAIHSRHPGMRIRPFISLDVLFLFSNKILPIFPQNRIRKKCPKLSKKSRKQKFLLPLDSVQTSPFLATTTTLANLEQSKSTSKSSGVYQLVLTWSSVNSPPMLRLNSGTQRRRWSTTRTAERPEHSNTLTCATGRFYGSSDLAK